MFFGSTVIAPGMRPVSVCDIGARTSITVPTRCALISALQLVDRRRGPSATAR